MHWTLFSKLTVIIEGFLCNILLIIAIDNLNVMSQMVSGWADTEQGLGRILDNFCFRLQWLGGWIRYELYELYEWTNGKNVWTLWIYFFGKAWKIVSLRELNLCQVWAWTQSGLWNQTFRLATSSESWLPLYVPHSFGKTYGSNSWYILKWLS